ncbi:MAG: hypothetical protein QM771_04660 [Nitrospira sp.]
MPVLAVHHGPLMYTKIQLCLEPLRLQLVAEGLRRAGHGGQGEEARRRLLEVAGEDRSGLLRTRMRNR